MIELIKLVPQIGIAVAIVAAGLMVAYFILKRVKTPQQSKRVERRTDPTELLRQVNKLVGVLTDGNGDPIPPSADNGVRFTKIEKTLDSHGKMHRKQFAVIADLRKGQNEILDHITGGNSKRPDPNYDIDLEDTGRFVAAAIDVPEEDND